MALEGFDVGEADPLGSDPRFEVELQTIRGVPTRVWAKSPATLRSVYDEALTYAEREFLLHDQERVTFEAFGRAVASLADELSRFGLAKGDRVMLALPNLPEWPVIFFAAANLGAIVTLANPAASEAEFGYMIEYSGARIAFVSGQRAAALAASGGAGLLELVVACRDRAGLTGPLVRPIEDMIGAPNDWAALPPAVCRRVDLSPDDDATIIYTSGTTGMPKGVLSTHRNHTASIPQGAFAQARKARLAGTPPADPDAHNADQVTDLILTPLFHVSGCSSSLLPMMYIGGRLILMRWWLAQRGIEIIAREKVNILGGVPTVAAQFIDHPARSQHDLSSLVQILCGGAPAAPQLVAKIAAAGIAPGNSWGMTETTGAFTGHVGQEYVDRPDSCGKPTPVGEVEVRDLETGAVVAPGEAGELWVKGPQVMKGYWRDPEETAKVLQDGWLRTGDVCRFDAEGYCYIVDRAKDMLIRSGENIYCTELENVLAAHPAVAEAAVFGVPHPQFGEDPIAVVAIRQDAKVTEKELRAFAGERLPAYKTPVRILIAHEPLPRSATGKLLRRDVRRKFEASASAAHGPLEFGVDV